MKIREEYEKENENGRKMEYCWKKRKMGKSETEIARWEAVQIKLDV